MTLTEYMHYEPPPGLRDELLEGELILSPSPNKRHADLCHRILMLLEAYVPDGYVNRWDTTMRLDEEEDKGNRPRPDVFVIDEARWEEAEGQGGYPAGSPELAIEVLSPSTEQVDRTIKVPKYLEHGSLAVWLVDGDQKCITVYSKDRPAKRLTSSDLIHLPPQLGEESIPVADIFAQPRGLKKHKR